MTKIDIISGFLGAGKTTLIKKIVADALGAEKIVIIENEFGEIGIDGGFLKDAGITVTEMNSGCICCSLSGDFSKALEKVIIEYSPDRIIIEPSGVGKLSDVITAVKTVLNDNVKLNSFSTVADASRFKVYHKNFGEFFDNQIISAKTVILSHTDGLPEEKINSCTDVIKSLNPNAVISVTSWEKVTGKQLLDAIESDNEHFIKALISADNIHGHEHGDECDCSCHDHHEHHEHKHHHEDHDHEHHEHHDHEHHHEECECGCHNHHEHGHHHADEVFTSWGKQTSKKFSKAELETILNRLEDNKVYGDILRAKGIVVSENGEWIHFDYVPGQPDIRNGGADITGRVCVIGAKINEKELEKLFD